MVSKNVLEKEANQQAYLWTTFIGLGSFGLNVNVTEV